jgi:hypothetical protein
MQLLDIRYQTSLCKTNYNSLSGMSLEAGNWRKSPVTLAVTAGYFFSFKKNKERKFI